MIAHVVLMTPKPDLSPADRLAFVAAFERALREIPTVRGVRIGHRVKHGAGYESATADYLAVIDFEDVAGLQTYLGHPAHAELARRFYEVMGSVSVFDFAVGGVEAIADLAGGG